MAEKKLFMEVLSMTRGERLYALRKERHLTMEDVAKACGVSRTTIKKWESDFIESMRADKLQALADILHTSINYILDGSDPNQAYRNIEPMPQFTRVPILGGIACGEPIMADQNLEGFAFVDGRVHADFALRCEGDSMINAHIFDGDLVFIKAQPEVQNGEIAAVGIGEEATLKRVYVYNNRIELRPENPLFPVLNYEGHEMAEVHILGKAVAFLGVVR